MRFSSLRLIFAVKFPLASRVPVCYNKYRPVGMFFRMAQHLIPPLRYLRLTLSLQASVSPTSPDRNHVHLQEE